MTVITKPLSENKADKPLEKPLVVSVNDGTGLECAETGCDRLSVDGSHHHHHHHQSGHAEEVDLWTWAAGAGGSARRRRVSATTTVCVFVATLVMLTGAIIGGVYIYRQFTHNQMSRFRGWCGVPFKRNSLRMLGPQSVTVGQSSSSHWPPRGSMTNSFNEQFDLDLGTDLHEEIFVPDFGIGRDAHFVHDFMVNLTAILDVKERRCFVIPLDFSAVVTPRNLMNILHKMWLGFHDGNMRVIRHTMRVVRPPVSDFSKMGTLITTRCKGFTTYRLEKITRVHDVRLKRSADDAAAAAEEEGLAPVVLAVTGGGDGAGAEMPAAEGKQHLAPYKQSRNHFTVAEFAGKAIIEYTILDE